MTNLVTVQSLKCPECGGPIKVTTASCPHCGVGLLIDRAAILGVPEYRLAARDVILDAEILALLEQEAKEKGVEMVPAMSGTSIFVYVRHAVTQKLVGNGLISSFGDSYVLMGDKEHWQIFTKTKLGGERVYTLGKAYSIGCHRLAEGEKELGMIPEIKEWVRECIEVALQKPAEEPAPQPGIWQRLHSHLFDFAS
ncbi:hypothetical protein KAZ66_04810 [Candidatus Woesebacteria bacterium]|nr:hypothetical protein [Candidatus Woesebacteria bacterium]